MGKEFGKEDQETVIGMKVFTKMIRNGDKVLLLGRVEIFTKEIMKAI